MRNFLSGNDANQDLHNNIKDFISITQTLYPNVTQKEIMDDILEVITSGKAQIGDEIIVGYEAYKDTAWVPNSQDLTKMLVGDSTGDARKDRILVLDELLKRNGIKLNELGGARWLMN